MSIYLDITKIVPSMILVKNFSRMHANSFIALLNLLFRNLIHQRNKMLLYDNPNN